MLVTMKIPCFGHLPLECHQFIVYYIYSKFHAYGAPNTIKCVDNAEIVSIPLCNSHFHGCKGWS